jgi:hypothetical protein
MPEFDRHSDNHQEIDPHLLMQLAQILLPLSLITAFLVSLAIFEF